MDVSWVSPILQSVARNAHDCDVCAKRKFPKEPECKSREHLDCLFNSADGSLGEEEQSQLRSEYVGQQDDLRDETISISQVDMEAWAHVARFAQLLLEAVPSHGYPTRVKEGTTAFAWDDRSKEGASR